MASSLILDPELSGDEFTLIEEKDLSGYNVEGVLSPKPEDLEALRVWLNPTDYDAPGGELDKNQNTYTKHTGQWLPQTEQYKKLFSSSEIGLMWIQGIPGSGKSVIAARIITELSQSGVPLCYFFFREIRQRNRTQRQMVIDWLAQLITVHPPSATRLLQLHKEGSNSDSNSISTVILWSIFCDAVRSMRKVYLVIDALDEMDPSETKACVADLGALAIHNSHGIKIIVTSRPNPEVQNGFKGITAMVSLRLDCNAINSDVRWYASQRLQDSTNTRSMDDEARENLVDDLLSRGKGLFLYVKLALDEIIQPEDELQYSAGMVSTLPDGIVAMYSYLLDKHRKASGMTTQKQVLVLQVLLYSAGTVSLTMLSNILNMNQGEVGLEMPILQTKAIIRRICGPLLDIKEETVNPVHHSFTEYLTNKNGVRGLDVGDFPILTIAEGHKVLCDLCITYLNYESFKKPGVDMRPTKSGCIVRGLSSEAIGRNEKWPFRKYAIYNWGLHARNGNVEDDTMFHKMTAHLETEGSVFTQLRGDNLDPYPDIFTPLHIAAAFGVKHYVLWLLQRGAAIDAVDNRGRTPLMHAAKGGHPEVLELLKHHGAQLEVTDDKEWTAFHLAAKRGHYSVVRRLIELGMPPNPEGKRPRKYGIGLPSGSWREKVHGPAPIYTPLRLAIQYGHDKVVAEILPRLQPEDAIFRNPRKPKGKTILHYAASLDRAEIVSHILKAGLVDVNQMDIAGRTALIRAIQQDGSIKTVRILLDHGADPLLGNPLHACTQKGDFEFEYGIQKQADVMEIISALLAAGANLNSKDKHGNTPLFYSASQDPHLLEWLVQQGADVHARNTSGETPLHHTKTQKNMEILLKAGADPNARDLRGITPLLAIKSNDHSHASFAWVDILRLFIQHGADPYIRNYEGISAFHYYRDRANDLCKLSQVSGIDINARDIRGRTLLHQNCYEFHDELPVEFDLNAQDNEGNTPLHVARNRILIEKLLFRGANPCLRNNKGQLPIHSLLSDSSLRLDSGSEGTIDKKTLHRMLDSVDVNSLDKDCNSLLHLAAISGGYKYGNKETLRIIVDHGVNISARNGEGKTALHLAAESDNDVAIFLTFLKSCLDSIDVYGRTPLHYAAMSPSPKGITTQDLIDAGAALAVLDVEGRTPLHAAAESGRPNAVFILVQHYSHHSPPLTLDMQDYRGMTPLHYAAASGCYASVQCLLDMGASPHVNSFKGQTPLHSAAEFGNRASNSPYSTIEQQAQLPRVRDVSRLLLEYGVDLEHRDCGGHTALDIAGIHQTVPLLQALYEFTQKTSVTPDKDLLSWVITRASSSVCYSHDKDQVKEQKDKELEEHDSHIFSLVRTATSAKAIMEALLELDQFQGPRKALWRALKEVNEAGVLSLIKNWPAYDFSARGEVQDNAEVPFERQVVRFVIAQGWMSVLTAVLEKFGFDDQDIFSVETSRDPNLDMLQALLPRMCDPNVKMLQQGFKYSINNGESLLHIFTRSRFPWHSQAVGILIQDPRVDVSGTAVGVKETTASALHTALGWPHVSYLGRWTKDTALRLLACPRVDVNAHTPCTPLELAVCLQGTVYAHALIKAGADIHIGEPLAHCIANPEALKLLLDCGVQLPTNHFMLLEKFFSSKYWNIDEASARCESLKALLAAGVNPDALSLPHQPGSDNSDDTECMVRDPPICANELAIDGEHTGFRVFHHYYEKYIEPKTNLHNIAMRGGYPDFVAIILANASVDVCDSSGRTPLMVACASVGRRWCPNLSPLEIGLQLLQAGASPLAVDNAGYSALDYLLLSRTNLDGKPVLLQFFEALLDAGAACAPSRHYTMLFAATEGISVDWQGYSKAHEHTKVWLMLQLLKHGVDSGPHVRDNHGNTLMHFFLTKYLQLVPSSCTISSSVTSSQSLPQLNTREIYDTVFSELLARGKKGEDNPNMLLVQNDKGETPLYNALRQNNYFAAEVFEKVMDAAGPLINNCVLANNGRTLLHAVGEEDVSGSEYWEKIEQKSGVMTKEGVFKYLLDIGFDEQQVDNEGLTPLELASLMGHKNLVAAFETL